MTTALMLIDFQNDYFPGGKWELEEIYAAANNAVMLLTAFREKGFLIVHVRHEFSNGDAPFFQPDSDGAKTHRLLAPKINEPVVLKHQVNSFQETNLKEILDAAQIDKLVICGAMSHMCIDGTTRAARDFGYDCVVAHDACATRDLEFDGVNVAARQVHAAYMEALGFAYAKVMSSQSILLDSGQSA
jgi:nicotinamidase-related amidase